MFNLGILLAIFGVLLGFGSFFYALSNMARFFKSIFEPGSDVGMDDNFGNVGTLFSKHLGAIGVMVAGSLMTVIGIGIMVFESIP